jgi:hypothetical protein
MWTLLTEDKKGATPGLEALPLFFDGNLHVGFTYARQLAFRYQRIYSPAFTLAASLENSQYQFSASNAPSNFEVGGILRFFRDRYYPNVPAATGAQTIPRQVADLA